MEKYVSEEEVVYDVSNARSSEELKAMLKHNERAKTLRAERRERERCEAPTLAEKFVNGIRKLFGHAKAKQTEQSQQKSR